MRALLERYPDAKLIYIARDPVSTIPSGMSLLTGVLDQSYDIFNSTRDEDRARYLENLYQGSCEMYRAFDKVRDEIPEENLRIVEYPRLMGDLENVMQELVEFTGVEPAPGFAEQVKAQAEKQRSRKSGHKYSLEKFGLDEQRIRKDLAFVYDKYDVS